MAVLTVTGTSRGKKTIYSGNSALKPTTLSDHIRTKVSYIYGMVMARFFINTISIFRSDRNEMCYGFYQLPYSSYLGKALQLRTCSILLLFRKSYRINILMLLYQFIKTGTLHMTITVYIPKLKILTFLFHITFEQKTETEAPPKKSNV